jgi:hypothetical protein
LTDAKKNKRKLKILFWYPQFTYVLTSLDIEISNDNTNENVGLKETVLRFADINLRPLLEKSPFLQQVFAYRRGANLAANSKKYDYKVFLLES